MFRKSLIALGVIAALMLHGLPLAAKEGSVQAASGTVVAVTEGAKTVVIESTLDGKPWIVGARVADDTKFEGRAKGLTDLKPGDRVKVQWVVQADGALARKITAR